MAACSRVGAGYGTAMLDAVLSITVLAAILLVIGANLMGDGLRDITSPEGRNG